MVLVILNLSLGLAPPRELHVVSVLAELAEVVVVAGLGVALDTALALLEVAGAAVLGVDAAGRRHLFEAPVAEEVDGDGARVAVAVLVAVVPVAVPVGHGVQERIGRVAARLAVHDAVHGAGARAAARGCRHPAHLNRLLIAARVLAAR